MMMAATPQIGRPKKYGETKILSASMDFELYQKYEALSKMLDVDKSELFRLIFKYFLDNMPKK